MPDILWSLGFDSSGLAKEASAAMSSLNSILGSFQMPSIGSLANIQPPKIDLTNFDSAKASLGELERVYEQLRADFMKGQDPTMLKDVQDKLRELNTELKGVSDKAGKKPFDLATASASELQRELSRLQRNFVSGMDTSQIVAVRERLRETKIEMGQISGESFVSRLKNAFSQSLSDATNWQQNILEIAGGNIIANMFEKVGQSIVNVGKYAINSAAQFESLRSSLDVIGGSGAAGGKIFNDLQQLAVRSPFSFADVGEYGKRLIAMGVPLDDVANKLGRIGDISAGVGREKLPQIAYAYGEIKANGVAMSSELRQLTTAGVPIIDYLAEVMGKPIDQIKKLASESKVGFKDIDAAFTLMTDKGGKFFDMMNTQSNNFEGLWSTMEDSFQVLAASLGAKFLPVAKEILKSIIDTTMSINNFVNNAASMGATIQTFKNVGIVVGGMAVAFNAATIAANVNRIATYANSVAQGVLNGISAAGNSIRLYVGVTVNALNAAYGNATLGTYALAAAQNALNFAMTGAGFLTIAGAAVAAYGAYKIYQSYVSQTTEQEQYAIDSKQSLIEKYKDERGKIDALFGVLNNEKAKRSEQAIAAKEVAKMYNELGLEYVKEETLLAKGDAALKERKRLQEELRDATLDRISETYKSEQIALIQNELLSNRLKQRAFNQGDISAGDAVGTYSALTQGALGIFGELTMSGANWQQRINKILDENNKSSLEKLGFLAKNLKSTNKEVLELMKGEDYAGLFDTKKFMKENEEAMKKGFASDSLAGMQERLKGLNQQLSETSSKSGAFNSLGVSVANLNEKIKELQDRLKLLGLNANSLAGLQARLSIVQDTLNKANPDSDNFSKAISETVELNAKIKELQDRIKEGSLVGGSMEMLNFQMTQLTEKLNKQPSGSGMIPTLRAQIEQLTEETKVLKRELGIDAELNTLSGLESKLSDINAKLNKTFLSYTNRNVFNKLLIDAKLTEMQIELLKVKKDALMNGNLPTNNFGLGVIPKEAFDSLQLATSKISNLKSEIESLEKMNQTVDIKMNISMKQSELDKIETQYKAVYKRIYEAQNGTLRNLNESALQGIKDNTTRYGSGQKELTPFSNFDGEKYLSDLAKLNDLSKSNPFQSLTEGSYKFAESLGMAHDASIDFATNFTSAMLEVAKSFTNSLGGVLFSFGEGLGGLMVGVSSFSEVAQKALFDLGKAILVEVPKAVGLGLIQSAFTPQALLTFPANLGLAAIGLGIMGVSGIASGVLGGLEKKNQQKTETNLPNVNTATNLATNQSQNIIGGGGLSAVEPNINFSPNITVIMENIDGIIKDKITTRVLNTEKFK